MKFVCKICFLLAFVWFAGLVAFNYKISHYQVDENVKTDAIVVLTGGAYRIKEAFRLLNEDLSDTLFISGVEKKISRTSTLNRWANLRASSSVMSPGFFSIFA